MDMLTIAIAVMPKLLFWWFLIAIPATFLLMLIFAGASDRRDGE